MMIETCSLYKFHAIMALPVSYQSGVADKYLKSVFPAFLIGQISIMQPA